MSDDVIERADAAYREVIGEYLRNGTTTTIKQARIAAMTAALSAFRAGDTLPNGLVVMPEVATRKMLDKFFHTMILRRPLEECYAAMRNAAKEE